MRIGYGFDVHKFGGKKPLTICGVHIPYSMGILAHSDGDVALHAIIDALLGAAALGDIGELFPNTNQLYKNANSRELLRIVWQQIVKKGYYLGNLDITLVAQVPQMTTYILQMRLHIIEDLCCHMNDINIKATTTEQLGFIGRKEGIACAVVVLLAKVH